MSKYGGTADGKTKEKFSIRSKLIGVIVPIVILIIVAFSLLARDIILKISKEKLLAQSQAYTEEINAWAQQIFSELHIYQNTIENGSFSNDKEILEYLEKTLDQNEAYPIGLYMGDDSGVYLDGSGWVPDADWVLTERDWYVDGKNNETFAFGEPYYDSMTGDVCVSASVRVDYDKAVRVLATDVYLDYVAGLVSEVSDREDIEAFLVTGNSNTIIAHPDTGMIANSLDAEGFDSLYTNISNAIKEGKDGIISVQGDNNKYYVALNKVDNTDWYFVTYITERSMLSDLHWTEMYMVIIAFVATVILVFGILRITGQVVNPVKRVTNVIGQIAEGDFTHNLTVTGSDEVAIMSNNMQMFISQMRNTIMEISNTAEWLRKQSVENEKVSNSLLNSSQSQASSMELLGKLAEELSNEADEVAKQMDYLADLVKQTNEDGVTAKELMRESVVMSQSGKDDMEHINNGMQSISTSINTLSEQIGKVGTAMEQIGGMVSIIMDIARLTKEIGDTVDQAVFHMNASVSEVEKSVEIVSEARTTFVGLYGKVDETSRHVEEMIELVDKVDNVANRLDQIMDRQHEAARQIVDSAKEMNHNTENVTLNSRIVEESAEELKKESIELMEKMSKFKL